MKSIKIIKLIAKAITALFAGFILFMFVGESMEGCKRPPSPKNTLSLLKVGETQTIKDSIPTGSWQSANPKVATVYSLTGVVTAVETGVTKITHSYPGGEIVYLQSVDVRQRNTIILLTLMGLYWLTLVLIWWKEKSFSILNVVSLLVLLEAIHFLNGIPFNKMVWFLVGGIPTLVILICIALENKFIVNNNSSKK